MFRGMNRGTAPFSTFAAACPGSPYFDRNETGRGISLDTAGPTPPPSGLQPRLCYFRREFLVVAIASMCALFAWLPRNDNPLNDTAQVDASPTVEIITE